ncbi:MAG: hypothetical protein U5N86_13450 [Planctomycetota bacterium]|nr:hypothetical protein [Planctomycetota bacterium]
MPTRQCPKSRAIGRLCVRDAMTGEILDCSESLIVLSAIYNPVSLVACIAAADGVGAISYLQFSIAESGEVRESLS